MNAFAGRTAVLATKHGKQTVIAPVLRDRLGLDVVLAPGVDTDAFGTFTRETPRTGTALDAARRKARAALAAVPGVSLALASEGSFGPHPALPFASADAELVLLLDAARDLELVGEHVTLETAHAHAVVADRAAARAFAARVGFPAHALVVLAPEDAGALGADGVIAKGITDGATLDRAVDAALARWGRAHVEHDLRADRNPTRMAAIARAAEDLAARAASACPRCDRPGFWVAEYLPGLPCAWCGAPTRRPRAAVWRCVRCAYAEERGSTERGAAAWACDVCNP